MSARKSAEWRATLNDIREAMRRRLVTHGLDMEAEPLVVDDIIDGEFGATLRPGLPKSLAALRDAIDHLRKNATTRAVAGNADLDSLTNLVMVDAAEAGFLLGVIAGTCLPWELVEALPAPARSE